MSVKNQCEIWKIFRQTSPSQIVPVAALLCLQILYYCVDQNWGTIAWVQNSLWVYFINIPEKGYSWRIHVISGKNNLDKQKAQSLTNDLELLAVTQTF